MHNTIQPRLNLLCYFFFSEFNFFNPCLQQQRRFFKFTDLIKFYAEDLTVQISDTESKGLRVQAPVGSALSIFLYFYPTSYRALAIIMHNALVPYGLNYYVKILYRRPNIFCLEGLWPCMRYEFVSLFCNFSNVCLWIPPSHILTLLPDLS